MCTLYSISGRESNVLSVIFSTLSALISMNLIVRFRIKIAEKSFYGICCMRNLPIVTILWVNNICTIK